ncbi:TonB-dependent siderophore receptor [Chitinolyticbacter albus]|uniref:TonB-dependent siderophore receptor n=1 Tax=Chitinolyticbacter albus TaxID=2961951 RepID=UPI00210E2364|nr:TonB-dependent receptor [Chitinolyticbacter albus]
MSLALAYAAPNAFAADETTLPTVTVTAGGDAAPEAKTLNEYRAKTSNTGALGARSVRDTPFSMEIVTSDFVKNTQATTLGEIFKADASVGVINNGYIGEASGITIRGLQLDLLNGMKIDGYAVPNWGSDLPLEHFEQVELLKGMAGFMYGFGQPGGIANFISKRPTNQPLLSATAGYKNDGVFQLEADVGGRFGEDNRFGYRVGAVHEQGDTFVEDGGHIKRDSVSAAVDWRITPAVTLSADALYQKRRVDAAYYGLILGQSWGMGYADIPEPIDGSKRLAPQFTYYETEYKIAGTELNWAVNDNWDVKVGYRYSQQDRLNKDAALILIDNDGTYGATQYASLSRYEYQNLQAMATGRFTTGVVQHELVFGQAWQSLVEKFGGFNQAMLGLGNLNDPAEFTDPNLSVDHNPKKSNETTQVSTFVSDTITFSPQWSALVGLRYTEFKDQPYANGEKTGTAYEESPLTPTVAVIYKPVEPVSIYGSYVESLEKGTSAPLGTTNYRAVFEPMKSRQYEMGVKAEYPLWSAGAALFHLERGLGYANSSNTWVQGGEEVYQGLETSAKAVLARDWTVLASAMWLDPEIAEAGDDINGNRPYNAARFQANAYAEYRLPALPGLVLTGSAQYVGERPLDTANEQMAGSYTLYGLGARYLTKVGNEDVTLRLNLDNLTNEKYWQTSWGFILTQGAPRTLRASAQISF